MIKVIQENSNHKLDQSPIPYFFRESQEHSSSDFFSALGILTYIMERFCQVKNNLQIFSKEKCLRGTFLFVYYFDCIIT